MRGLTVRDSALLGGLKFNPLSLSPALWLDAADTSTITASSGDVSQWNDKSGNGYNFTQSTAANQPKTGTATKNGYNVIDFTTAAKTLTIGTTNLLRNVTGATIYSVHKIESAIDSQMVSLVIRTGTAGFSRMHIETTPVSSVNKIGCGGRTLDADSFRRINNSTEDYNWRVQTGLFDYANTDMYSYVGRTQDASDTSFQSATTTSDIASVNSAVHVKAAIGSVPYNGTKIAELLVFHAAHDLTTRTQVWDYLYTKWGL